MSVAEKLSGYQVTSRNDAGEFLNEIEPFVQSPGGVSKLRELILDLAVRGKLVSQDDSDEPSTITLDRVKRERFQLQKAKLLSHARIDPDPTLSEIPHALPEGWAWTRLSILGQISPKNDVADETVVSFLPMASVGDGFAGTIAPERRAWREIKKGFTHVADGDVVLAKITPCFQNRKSAVMRGLTNGVGAGTTELHVFRPIGDAVLPEFVLLNLKCLTFLEIGVSKMTGSAGQKRVPRDYFAKTAFPLPPLAEQRRIVVKVDGLMRLCDELEAKQAESAKLTERSRRSVLASLTGSRDARELSTAWRRLSDHFEILLDHPETLADLRQTILALAVQGKLVKQDPDDEPASLLLNSVLSVRKTRLNAGLVRRRKSLASDEVHDPIFVAPAAWAWSNFEFLADLTSGVTKGRKLAGRETAEYPYLRVANVQRWRLSLGTMKTIQIPIDELEKYRVLKGDLLMTEGGDWDKLGRTAIWNDEIADCLHQNHVFRARVFHDGVVNRWLMLFMNSPIGRGYFESASKKTTNLASINMTQLRGCPVPVPPTAEQKRIVAKVDRLLAHCDRVAAGLRDRQTTTHQLLTASIHRILDESTR